MVCMVMATGRNLNQRLAPTTLAASAMSLLGLASQIEVLRKLGDVYEKRRRVEELIRACEDAEELEHETSYAAELAELREMICSSELRHVVLEDPPASSLRAAPEDVGETLDELFGGLDLTTAGATGATTDAPAMRATKVVELKPGRQYRKAVRKHGGRADTTVVQPATLDATSADEREDEELEELEDRANGMTGADSKKDSDADYRALEAARYGGGDANLDGNPNGNAKGLREIPVAGDVLARAAGAGARGGGQASDSSGGSTHAVVGRNRGEWYGRVGADERRLGVPSGSSSGSESGESLTSPAVVAESAWRK